MQWHWYKSAHSSIPVFHAIKLVADYSNAKNHKKVLLLATKFTMEDGFFAKTLESKGIEVIIPALQEGDEMQRIHGELMLNIVIEESRDYFSHLIRSHQNLDAVILGCTEYPLVVDGSNSVI